MNELLKQFGLEPIPTPESVAVAMIQTAITAIASPEVQQGLSDLFAPSSLDVAQDVLKACEHGKLSHNAALQMVAIALADDQERKLKRIN
jgi:hypothetical protein